MQKTILTTLLSLLLFLGAALVQADPAGETPQQALKDIVELYKNEDWEGLVKTRCVDSKHAVSEEEMSKLVSSVKSQFSDDELRDALIASYEAALSVSPRIESEGTVAIFASDYGSVKLSKMNSGAWGLRF